MKFAAVCLAIAAALALQTTIARFVIGGAAVVDLVLVVVVYAALTSGPVGGLWTGTVAGIAQDALSGGIVGVGGLSKTVVGFLVGVIGSQFIVTQTLPRVLVFFVATILHAFFFLGLYAMLDPKRFSLPYAAVLAQAGGNALVGAVVLHLLDLLPAAAERRRASRGQAGGRRGQQWDDGRNW